MKMEWLVIGIIFLFIGTCVIPSTTSVQIIDKNIITVDDEPGDADFTSIKEAVNASNHFDTIEVYSGTYNEEGIRITKDNVSLLGISHELGGGNDSGPPFIKGNLTEAVIQVEASYVIVSNFRIENSAPASPCIRVGTDVIKTIYNITISECIIRNSTHIGINIRQPGSLWNIAILNNQISQCKGISYVTSAVLVGQKSCIITGNVITNSPYWGIYFDGFYGIISENDIADCQDMGIQLRDDDNVISGNRIRHCSIGIQFAGINNTINGNNIDSCPVGIQFGGYRNIITKNNFKNYSRIGIWFERWFGGQFNLLLKSRWIGNYWDTWIGVGPKIIFGRQAIPYGEAIFFIPGFAFDWCPSKKPYDT